MTAAAVAVIGAGAASNGCNGIGDAEGGTRWRIHLVVVVGFDDFNIVVAAQGSG